MRMLFWRNLLCVCVCVCELTHTHFDPFPFQLPNTVYSWRPKPWHDVNTFCHGNPLRPPIDVSWRDIIKNVGVRLFVNRVLFFKRLLFTCQTLTGQGTVVVLAGPSPTPVVGIRQESRTGSGPWPPPPIKGRFPPILGFVFGEGRERRRERRASVVDGRPTTSVCFGREPTVERWTSRPRVQTSNLRFVQ